MIAASAIAMCTCATPAQADLCELSWDVPCCPVPGTSYGVAIVTMTLCNCTDFPAEYSFMMKSPIPGLEFEPFSGFLVLLPGECVDIPITVYCPIGAPPIMGGYPVLANVTNLSTGAQFGCEGLVKPVQDWKIVATTPVIASPADPNVTIGVGLLVNDIGGAGNGGVDLTFLTMGPVNPPTPTFVPVQPGSTTVVNLAASFNPNGVGGALTEGGSNMPLTGALLILWDDDGDGVPEVNSSVNFRFTAPPCPGDLNGDGVTNGADLAGLLANWGLCNP